MVLLLALGVLSTGQADGISYLNSGLRSLAALQSGDFASTRTRGILVGGGLLASLVFGYLALKEIPRRLGRGTPSTSEGTSAASHPRSGGQGPARDAVF